MSEGKEQPESEDDALTEALQTAFKMTKAEPIPPGLYKKLTFECTMAEKDFEQPPFTLKRGLVLSVDQQHDINNNLIAGDIIISINDQFLVKPGAKLSDALKAKSPAVFKICHFKTIMQETTPLPDDLQKRPGYQYRWGIMYGIKRLPFGLVVKAYEERIYVVECPRDSIAYMTVNYGDVIVMVANEPVKSEEKCRTMLVDHMDLKGFVKIIIERASSEQAKADVKTLLGVQKEIPKDFAMPPDCAELADKAVRALKLPEPRPILNCREPQNSKQDSPHLKFHEKTFNECNIASDFAPENLMQTPIRTGSQPPPQQQAAAAAPASDPTATDSSSEEKNSPQKRPNSPTSPAANRTPGQSPPPTPRKKGSNMKKTVDDESNAVLKPKTPKQRPPQQLQQPQTPQRKKTGVFGLGGKSKTKSCNEDQSANKDNKNAKKKKKSKKAGITDGTADDGG